MGVALTGCLHPKLLPRNSTETARQRAVAH